MRTQISAALLVPAILLGAAGANAMIITVPLTASFADAPFTYDFGGGNSVTFTTVNPGFSFDPAGVSTGGTTQIASLGAPFFNPPQPTSYFSNRGGSIGPDTPAQFVSYNDPAVIRFSLSDSIIGLRFDLGQGFQYGYAQIAGSSLQGFRFQSTPSIGVAINAIPEPASWALLITGFGLTGMALRRRRTAGAITA